MAQNLIKAAKETFLLASVIILLFGGCLMVGNGTTPITDISIIQLWGAVFAFSSLGLLAITMED